jgi:putative lipoprotein
LALTVTVSACGSLGGAVNTPPPPITPTGRADSLANTSWRLVSFGPAGSEAAVLAGTTITLTFEADGRAGGSGGCNEYGSTVHVEGETLSFGEITSTLRACLDNQATEQESRYLAALKSARTFEVAGDQLTIWYDNGQGVLSFEKTTAAP